MTNKQLKKYFLHQMYLLSMRSWEDHQDFGTTPKFLSIISKTQNPCW